MSSRRYIFFGEGGFQKIPLLPSKKMKLALKEKLKFDFGSPTNTGKELKRFFETYFQFLFCKIFVSVRGLRTFAHHCVSFVIRDMAVRPIRLFFIHKSVWHMSLTQLLIFYGLGFELADIIVIDNRLPAINNTESRRLCQ